MQPSVCSSQFIYWINLDKTPKICYITIRASEADIPPCTPPSPWKHEKKLTNEKEKHTSKLAPYQHQLRLVPSTKWVKAQRPEEEKKNNTNKLLSAIGLLVNPSQDSSLRKRNWKMNSPLARQAKAFIGHMPFTRYKSRFQVTLIYDETCLHVPIQNMIISQTYAGGRVNMRY